MEGVWQVVHDPRVAVRKEPSTTAQVVDCVQYGETFMATLRQGAWVRVGGVVTQGGQTTNPGRNVQGWVLTDGTTVGLGTLLERIDNKMMHLLVRSPWDDSVLCEVDLPGDTLLQMACKEVAKVLELDTFQVYPTLLPRAGTLQPRQVEFLAPDKCLYDAGFRDGSDLRFFYRGRHPNKQEPSVDVEALRQRLESGKGTWADIKAAVLGQCGRQAIEALLVALAAGSQNSGALLFAWSFAPRLHGIVREGTEAPTALLFGWGGCDPEQLKGIRKWWCDRGFGVLATTGCPRQCGTQVCEIIKLIPEGPLVIHVFSNTGMFLLKAFRQKWTGRIDGVVIDSAADTSIDVLLMRRVAKLCIRALCNVFGAGLNGEAQQALDRFEPLLAVQEGDRLSWDCSEESIDGRPVVLGPDGELRGALDGAKKTVDRSSVEAALGGAVNDGPLSAQQVVRLAADFKVNPLLYPRFDDVLLTCDSPALFLFSTNDSMIRAKAVREFIGKFTKEGQATSVCFEKSNHVEHFSTHRARYKEELGKFIDALRLP